MITTEELRELASSTHPMHGDLVRAAKELDQLRAQMAAQAAGEAGYRDGYRSVIREVSAERDALRDELDRLRSDNADYEASQSKFTSILAATADALKGAPAELTRHDWSDLAAVAGKIVAERDQQREKLDRLRAEVERIHAERKSINEALHAANESDAMRGAELFLLRSEFERLKTELHESNEANTSRATDEMVDRALVTWYGTPYTTPYDSPNDRADMYAYFVAAFRRRL